MFQAKYKDVVISDFKLRVPVEWECGIDPAEGMFSVSPDGKWKAFPLVGSLSSIRPKGPFSKSPSQYGGGSVGDSQVIVDFVCSEEKLTDVTKKMEPDYVLVEGRVNRENYNEGIHQQVFCKISHDADPILIKIMLVNDAGKSSSEEDDKYVEFFRNQVLKLGFSGHIKPEIPAFRSPQKVPQLRLHVLPGGVLMALPQEWTTDDADGGLTECFDPRDEEEWTTLSLRADWYLPGFDSKNDSCGTADSLADELRLDAGRNHDIKVVRGVAGPLTSYWFDGDHKGEALRFFRWDGFYQLPRYISVVHFTLVMAHSLLKTDFSAWLISVINREILLARPVPQDRGGV
ncbi:MAG: hypothetical protein H6907_17970 [Hyphomicrobiales bacterium]|nr:hypothetical protein [Hyphomicrobiales bacterium]MCP5373621.1 hypothetical protein [Hyphomicrobiales bacterium]